jgi:3-oxoacyl-[acyl-carrier protein] reductase
MARAETVAIVTGAASEAGREVAVGLAGRGWAIVVVYLEYPRRAEVTVAEILAAEGITVAVRADLADELDVRRLFTESIASFGGVDAVAHTTTESPALLYRYAARHVRDGGVIVGVRAGEPMAADVAQRLRERGITVSRAPPDRMLPFLTEWGRP